MNPLLLLLIIPVVVMVVSDFRCREISLLWVIVFGVCCFGLSFGVYGIRTTFYNILFNILLIVYLGCGVGIYLWIKNKKIINPLKVHTGIGDLLFVLFMTPLFAFRAYAIFLVLSFIGSLIYWIVATRITRKQTSIPLVGTLGIALCGYLIINTIRA